jgi:DNA topoisomerase-1
MSKLYSKSLNFNKPILVIVESPAKCKKIEEYLGSQYKCLASFGHLRELPSLDSIDFHKNYHPTYKIIDQPLKKKQIITLRNAINESNEVILATDDDREGEAIAWHLCQLFDLSVERTKRIVFHEITESAVKRAIQNPRTIDMLLVEAQQCRQILDLIVGFKVSPILWKHIVRNAENSLSAGRCQTPALKLIYDNQQEIEKNPPIQIYQLIGYFTSKNLPFELNHSIENKDEIVTDFLNDSIDFPHMYSCSTPTKGYKAPPEPFTTSRLQQVASNELHYSPKETMKLCQTLYEAGHITYMRTDSKVYSEPFLHSAKTYIVKEYGEKYFLEPGSNSEKELKKPVKKDEKNLAQEAHEAIRPTHIEIKNFGEESKLGAKERKMYQLIWRNTMESCMTPASYFSVTATITAPKIQGIDKPFKYTYSCEKIDFLGWKIVVKKPATTDYFQYLQTLGTSSISISYQKIIAKTSLKNQLLHYTEARLVQLLEEKGIGRPSTFSTLIDKIQERGYVKKQDVTGKSILCKDYEILAKDSEIYEIETTKEFGNEKNKLVIQPTGIIVLEFLMSHFNELFNYDYTRMMEEELDQISKGLKVGYEVCRECDSILETKIGVLKQEKQEKKLEYQIDDTHFYILGKYGPVIKKVESSHSNAKDKKSTVSFLPLNPEIKIDLHKLEKREYRLEDLIVCEREKKTNIDKDKVGNDYSIGEFEGHSVFIKKGKFGLYLCYGEKGKTTKSLSNLGNRPLESISWEEVKGILEEDKTGTEVNVNGGLVRKITNSISIRKSKKGEDYLFFKTEKMKRPQFFDISKFGQEFKEMDYKTCDLEFLLQWIKNKHSIF